MNLLITAIGKRVQLIKHLKQRFKVIGVDAGELTPAKAFVDKFYKIPKANEKGYIDSILSICEQEKINVIIPLYEGEFEILHNERERFNQLGIVLLLSNNKILNVCKDKAETYKYFLNSKINIPKVYNEEEIQNIIRYGDINKIPLIIKPKDGMGSDSVYKINNLQELKFFKQYVKNGIVQEFVEGGEYTVDTLVDFKGNPIYVVPRKRLEVRSGEVVKSSTVRDEAIIKSTFKVVEHLDKLSDENGLGVIGPLTIQFFKKNSGEIYLLEINPRFGGGVPLSFEAGADYGSRIINMLEGNKVGFIREFKEMTMLRYDDAIFS